MYEFQSESKVTELDYFIFKSNHNNDSYSFFLSSHFPTNMKQQVPGEN